MATSRRNFLTRLAAGGAGAAVLAACGPGQGTGPGAGAPEVKFGEPVSVTFWHHQTGVNAEALEEMVRRFNATNGKGITAKGEHQVGYTEIYQKAMASIQAGQPPELAVAYESMVAEYMKANAVVDLDDYASKGPLAYSKESLNDIFPAYLESNRYPQFNNKLLSFPFTKSLAVRYYNEDLFKSAGVTKYGQQGGVMTFDDFKKGLAAVSKKDASGRPTVYGENIAVDASYIDAFIYANGGALLNNDNSKVRFNEPAGVEVLDMWGQLVQAGSAYVAQGRDYQPDFGGQKVAALHQSSSGRPFIKDFVVDPNTGQERFKWGIGLIPQKDPAKPQTVMYGGNITVFRTTPLKQAASWEWIKFFMDRDQTVQWAIKSGYMPTRKSAAESADMKAHWEKEPQAKQAFDLTPSARPEPGIPAWQDVRTLLQNALTAVVTGKSTAKAALDDAANQANRLIDEKR
jgi:ABC-type glycerol-3-phosphate transport system substrate-binding protein